MTQTLPLFLPAARHRDPDARPLLPAHRAPARFVALFVTKRG
jgi:hypothetical protein